MKIGIVIRELDPSRGGAEGWTCQFVNHLMRDGHEVHVIAEKITPELASGLSACHSIPRAGSNLQFAEAAESTLKRLLLDVVHDMGYGWHCDIFQPHGGSRIASFRQNLLLFSPWIRPLKRQVANWLPRYREFQQLLQRQYRQDGRRFIALSKMVARDMKQFHDVENRDLRLIYNGVDIERFSPEVCRPLREKTRRELAVRDETLFLIVSHNLRLKGVPTLLRALGQLKKQGNKVRLAIAGGKRSGAVQRLARRLGVEDAVSFLGPKKDVIPYYAAADVYVHPTFYDPCSLVVLEALACGLPVVTSRFNGAGELIRQGAEGFVVSDPGDWQTLAFYLEQLLEPRERETMACAARNLAEKHPFERNVREIVTAYEEVGGRRQAA